jgi:hypothetical protein
MLLAGAVTASGQKVKVVTDPGVDLAKYKTYSRDNGVVTANPLINQLIIEAIDRALTSKGLTQVDGNGDLKIAAWATVDSDLHVSDRSSSTPIGQQSASGIPAMTQRWDVSNGTLVVEITDPDTKNSLWRGTATSVLSHRPTGDRVKDAKNATKMVNKAVEKMFKKYPQSRGN